MIFGTKFEAFCPCTPHILTLSYAKRLAKMFFLSSLMACQGTSENISGTYVADVSSASDPDSMISLQLNEDQTAGMRTEYMDKTASIVHRGSWERTAKDSLTVFFVEKNGRMLLDTLGLRIKGSQLLLRDSNFDSKEITLIRGMR